ncbi:MAG: PorT family protein [Rikenellaceae bacterium]|nr:PorT family protein [Rikenellaceae bacterium]
MRKNYLLALAAGLLIAGSIHAQTQVSVGVKGGLNIPNITAGGEKTPLSEGYSSRTAGAGGIVVEFRFDRRWSLVTGLEYSGQGGRKTGMQAVPSGQILNPMIDGVMGNTALTENLAAVATGLGMGGNTTGATQVGGLGAALAGLPAEAPEYLYADFESTAKFNYIMLPVQARIGWQLGGTSSWRVYVQAGLFGSYLVSGKRVSSGTSAVYANQDGAKLSTLLTGKINSVVTDLPARGAVMTVFTTAEPTTGLSAIDQIDAERDFNNTQGITRDLYRWNVGFIGAAGINYNLKCRHNFFLEAGGNYGFVKIQKNATNGQNRIGAGSVQIGYSYSLGKICRK